MRRLAAFATATVALLLTAGPALACGGLVGPNGAVNLLRTTTFAGYHAGVEHYITAFEFAGGEGEFGSIVPLPDVPSDVVKGGDWTLQRLLLETDPQPAALRLGVDAAGEAAGVEVLMEVRIDALDITVLRGGGDEVGTWATDHGFSLPPDAPEVLDFYARRSPIFLAAVFDADAARQRGQQVGDGTPVHITIPTDDPWVPLRILALGRQAAETVEADVYLLTDAAPRLLPEPRRTDDLEWSHAAWASDQLLDDLRSDRGMEWVPEQAFLSKIEVSADAANLDYDLAIDPTGAGAPSRVDAGLEFPLGTSISRSRDATDLGLIALLVVAAVPIGFALGMTRAPAGRRPPFAGAGG
jgi:Uncharacterized protein conserved in bacteria (DUF2330)